MVPRFSLAVALLLAARLAAAQPIPFWERVSDPHRGRVEALVLRAQAELGERGPGGLTGEAAARAEIWLEEALRLDAQSFLATVLLGEAQTAQRKGPVAVATFQRARRLARTPAEESWCSLRVAIEGSRAGRYPEALVEYDRHIRLGEAQAAAYTNSAEILMALGRLTDAQDRYREAIRLDTQEQPGRERDENLALAHYGLGVSLDRDEQTTAAREAVARAVAYDPRLTLLDAARDPGASEVFFVPPGDVHYYRGLTLMVLGRGRDASDAFQRFVAEQPGSRFVKRAESHLLDIEGGTPRPPVALLRVVAIATVRSDQALPAPLVDAAWRSRPALLDACLATIPVAVRMPLRVALDVEFDAVGVPRRVSAPGRGDLAPFASCVEARVKGELRVPRPGRTASARVELVLGNRR